MLTGIVVVPMLIVGAEILLGQDLTEDFLVLLVIDVANRL